MEIVRLEERSRRPAALSCRVLSSPRTALVSGCGCATRPDLNGRGAACQGKMASAGCFVAAQHFRWCHLTRGMCAFHGSRMGSRPAKRPVAARRWPAAGHSPCAEAPLVAAAVIAVVLFVCAVFDRPKTVEAADLYGQYPNLIPCHQAQVAKISSDKDDDNGDGDGARHHEPGSIQPGLCEVEKLSDEDVAVVTVQTYSDAPWKPRQALTKVKKEALNLPLLPRKWVARVVGNAITRKAMDRIALVRFAKGSKCSPKRFTEEMKGAANIDELIANKWPNDFQQTIKKVMEKILEHTILYRSRNRLRRAWMCKKERRAYEPNGSYCLSQELLWVNYFNRLEMCHGVKLSTCQSLKGIIKQLTTVSY